MALQFIIAMMAHALNEQMPRRVEYLQKEVGVLQEALATATGKSRVLFTPVQRRRLAIMGKALNARRATYCQIVPPAAILAWCRQLAARKYDSSKARRAGRPRKKGDIRALVLDLARNNPGWGYTRSATRCAG